MKQHHAPSEINKGALIFSAVIFFSTFSYWFVSATSAASVINLLMTRAVRKAPANEIEQMAEAIGWTAFFFHLLVTSLGLFLYRRSRAFEYLGNMVAMQYSVAGFFYQQNKTARTAITIYKFFTGFLGAYLLYNVLIQMAVGVIPHGAVAALILLFMVGGIGWFIKYPEPQKMMGYVGNLNNRNKAMWLRLEDKQMAYIQDANDHDVWMLANEKKELSISYTEAYIFLQDSFSVQLRDGIISEDILGKLIYSCRVEPVLANFPHRISTGRLHTLFNQFTTLEDFERVLFLSIDKSGVLKTTLHNTLDRLNGYFDNDPNIFNNQAQQSNEEFHRILNGYIDYNSISGDIHKEIEAYIYELFGKSDMFKVSFNITKIDFNMDGMLKEIIDLRKKTVIQTTEGRHNMQTAILNKTMDMLKDGPPNMNADKMRNMFDVMKDLFAGGKQVKEIDAVDIKQNEQQRKEAVSNASKQVITAITRVSHQNPSIEHICEVVSMSTPFFSEYRLPVGEFVEKFVEKMRDERVERTEEAYILLAQDTFTELMA